MNEYLYPLIAYICGSIPFGLILSECFGKGGLREKGSKNIGSTNVLRTQGKLLGALTLICDFSKALLPCYFLTTESEWCNLLILAAPTIGHIFPIWLKFKGGKGIATYFGTIASISWLLFILTAVVWIIMFIITRISSVSCLTSVACSLVIFEFSSALVNKQFWVLFLLIILIFIRHKENIRRLWNREEKRL